MFISIWRLQSLVSTQLLMTTQLLRDWKTSDLYIVPKESCVIKAPEFWENSTRLSFCKAQEIKMWHLQSSLPVGKYLVAWKELGALLLFNGQSFIPYANLQRLSWDTSSTSLLVMFKSSNDYFPSPIKGSSRIWRRCWRWLVKLINIGSLTLVENYESVKDSNIVEVFE